MAHGTHPDDFSKKNKVTQSANRDKLEEEKYIKSIARGIGVKLLYENAKLRKSFNLGPVIRSCFESLMRPGAHPPSTPETIEVSVLLSMK